MEVSLIQDLDDRGGEPPGENGTHYRLACPACASLFDDDGWVLECPRPHLPTLLKTVYSSRRLTCDEKAQGIYRYRCWLPVVNRLAGAGIPVTYKSERLCAILGLPNLWITFSGYWPERGATLETATFKELEAYGVLSRIRNRSSGVLVVASAGNTAAAFARVCSENDIRCLIVVPASGMRTMQFAHPTGPSVRIISLTEHANYFDAITFAEAVSRRDGFLCEGGVRNVGRRDGVGTAMVNAGETIGTLPDYYFQAIGSGAGAIAAHEAAKRLVEDSRFGRTLPHLMLSQNSPFTPIFDSWRRGRRDFIDMERSRARALTGQIVASVLCNQRPPYAVAGGMFDVLTESRGDMLAVGNKEALEAMRLFEESEGIDIDAAAGVALASLIEAARSDRVSTSANVLLHITGGGCRRRASGKKLMTALPNLELPLMELQAEEAVTKACDLF